MATLAVLNERKERLLTYGPLHLCRTEGVGLAR
jgi:hypothetical protein